MDDVAFFVVAGFAASFVDGALGMGFGPTCSSVLLATSMPPVAVSATVNLAKVTTGVVAAASHWRFGNIDRRLVATLAVAGSLGALVGGTVLASVDGRALRPVLAAVLLVVALRMLARFGRHAEPPSKGASSRGHLAAGALGGVSNALVGAWGPIVTPHLLQRGVSPRFAIGSANTAEVAVAAASAGTILATLGAGGLRATVLVALLAGGLVAAPMAAWAVRRMPGRALGLLVAGVLALTNVVELASWARLGPVRWMLYASVALLVAAAAYAGQARRAHA